MDGGSVLKRRSTKGIRESSCGLNLIDRVSQMKIAFEQ